MTYQQAPLRRIARFRYGDALPSDARVAGDVPVMSSGGVSGWHNRSNSGAPSIVVGRKGSHGSVHWSDQAPFVIDTAYAIDEKSSDCSLRWLYYALRAADLAALSADVGVPGLSRERAYEASIPLPPLAEQRRIADFLDDQVTRIDQAIHLRNQQIELLTEAADTAFDDVAIERGLSFPLGVDERFGAIPDGWVVRPLGHVVREFTNGYVGPTRDILVDDGVPYIQSVHIKSGHIDFQRRPFYVTRSWHQSRPRINLKIGDVLIVQTGDIGKVAVVPSDLGEASCHALQIARADESVVTGRYLGDYLRSHFGYQSMLSRATGALHPHLEASVKTVPIAVPTLPEQESIVEEVSSARDRVDRMATSITRAVTLLEERKRSLITAAVTGEFDVGSASVRARDGATRPLQMPTTRP